MDEGDNPVGINVTPLVDIIFCLCVFFMISFKFKQIEGKFDAWLPKGKGSEGMPVGTIMPKEIRVAILWDEANEESLRKFGVRPIKASEDELLQTVMNEAWQDFKRLNEIDVPLVVDADVRVPWKDVITVINIGKRVGIEKVEFAFGAPPPGKR
jgi:biopolymer transport protein ExbD